MSTSPRAAAARSRERISFERVHKEYRSAERMRTLGGKPRGVAAPVAPDGASPRGSVVHATGLSRKLAQRASAIVVGDPLMEREWATIAFSQLPFLGIVQVTLPAKND